MLEGPYSWLLYLLPLVSILRALFCPRMGAMQDLHCPKLGIIESLRIGSTAAGGGPQIFGLEGDGVDVAELEVDAEPEIDAMVGNIGVVTAAVETQSCVQVSAISDTVRDVTSLDFFEPVVDQRLKEAEQVVEGGSSEGIIADVYGKPVIVCVVLENTSGLSWESMVMWRAMCSSKGRLM